MDGSIFDSPAPATSSGITGILQRATQMANQGGPGANADKAQAWLQQQLQQHGYKTQQPKDLSGTIFASIPSAPKQEGGSIFASVPSKNIKSTGGEPDSKGKMALLALAQGVQTSILDPYNYLQSQFYNYITHPSDLATKTGGQVTPAQREAAKVLGVHLGNNWGEINKVSPEEARRHSNMAMTLYGLNPAEQAKRAQDISKGKTYSGPVEGLFEHSAISGFLSDLYNPNKSNTLLYHKVNEVVQLQNIISHPDQYSKDQVQTAKHIIDAYKRQARRGTWENVKGMAKEMVKHPLSLVNSIIADPELFFAPEAKAGMELYGARAAQAAEEAGRAAQMEELAGKVAGGSEKMPGIQEAATKSAEEYGAKKAAAVRTVKGLRRAEKAANVVSSGAAGAGINAGITAEQEHHEQGFVRGKDVVAAGAFGAGLGSIFAGLEGVPKDKMPTPELAAEYADRAKSAEDHIKAFDENANRQPGEALSPDTPIQKDGTVPYYGGVDANGHIIHLDKNAPNFVTVTNNSGRRVRIPVKKTVAYHESVEYPLMHMEGPISEEALAKLRDRIKGFGRLDPKVEAKLRSGESLSYPEAHQLATYAENKMVNSLYKVNPKKYQDSLKPFIKDIGKRSQKEPASDIPSNLDTKPYDDMGHSEQLKGQGNRPVVDKKQSGKIDRRLIATGVSAAGGSLAGSLLAPPNRREQGAVLGGLAGLFGAMNFWGDALRPRGTRRAEHGVFAGIGSRTAKLDNFIKAADLEKAGVSKEDIWKQTGMGKTADGKWLYEIPDNNVRFARSTLEQNPGHIFKLGQLMDHRELFNAYPDLKDINITYDPELQGAKYNRINNTITIGDYKLIDKYLPAKVEGAILHEVQHAIQRREGWPVGGSPYRERQTLLDIYTKDFGHAPTPDEMDFMDALAQDSYTKLAGETQARNVERRFSVLPETLQRLHPDTTSDIPIEQQIIRHHGQVEFNDISSQLKKTGEMDEEGKLSGMVLPEDHLPNEWNVVTDAKNGNQVAIGKLYKQYMPRLTRAMRGMVRTAGPTLGLDSEDIAHIAFTKAIQNLDKFKGDSAFYTWLYQIAKNTALNAIAKSRREVPTTSIFAQMHGGGDPLSGGIEARAGESMIPEAEKAAAETDTPEDLFVARQTSNMVKHALSKLPKDIREAVKMKEMEGLTEQEIAAQQGVPVGTVKSRLYRGRAMIQESLKKGHGAQFRKQGGFTTPEQLKKMAKIATLGTIGATAGLYYGPQGHKLLSAIEGAGLALTAGEIRYKNLLPAVKKAFSKEPWYNVNDLLNNYDHQKAQVTRLVSQVQYHIDKIVPNKESQIRITHYLDGNKNIELTPAEHRAARIARMFYDTVGKQALEVGVLQDFLENYVNHEWGDSAKAKELADKITNEISTNMSPKDRHALARKFLTLDVGKAHGLVPRTENINDLIKIYGDSMGRAIANKNLIGGLKEKTLDTSGKIKAVMPAGKAPTNYVAINHPQLRPFRVHPSIASSLDFLFHTYNNGMVMKGLDVLNTGTKRMEVSISLFHPKALVDAFLGARSGINPFKAIWEVGQAVVGKTPFHEQYLSGGAGDIPDKALKAGLGIDPKGGQISDEDLKTGFYEGLTSLQQFMDSVIPGTGNLPKAFIKLNKLFDKVTWENIHTGLKGLIFTDAYERMTRAWMNHIKTHPGVEMPPDSYIAEQAAAFANDVFGGLNWRRLADDAKTHIGRQIALALASPAGRRLSQFLLFAPDWTYSTVRSWTRALGEGSGLKGLIHPKYLADLHRQYILRSAIIYLTLYNAVNIAMSGHPIWDNKDPLTIDLGNGERMQANKHFMEVPHFVENPAKFLIGKLGIIPSEGIEQLTHKEYLTTGYMPDMKESRIAHLIKREMPFSGESFEKQGIPEMMLNLAGFPVYGSHPPRTEAEIQAASIKKRERARKAAATRRRHEDRMGY